MREIEGTLLPRLQIMGIMGSGIERDRGTSVKY